MNPTIRRSRRRQSRPQIEALEIRSMLSTAGALDPSFGGGRGFVAIPVSLVPFATDLVNSEAVQSDGKIVIAGTVTDNNFSSTFVLERLDADGSPDPTFGQGGLFTFPIPGPSQAQKDGNVASVLIQPDGKILVAGGANQFPTTGFSSPSYAVIRVNTDGTLDTSYGAHGEATYPFDPTVLGVGRLTSVTAAALQSDGKLVLVGSADNGLMNGPPAFGGDGSDLAAVRLNPDGSIDTSFGNKGTQLVPVSILGITADRANGVSIQPSGQIVLAGDAIVDATPNRFTVTTYTVAVAVRLNPDGSRDTSFGGPSAGGTQILPADPAAPGAFGMNHVASVTTQPDGKLLLSGTDATGTVPTFGELTRLNADGTLDTSFGIGGRVTISLIGPAAVQTDGKIVVAGIFKPSEPTVSLLPSGFSALRLNANGTPDPTFGNPTTPGLTRSRLGALILGPQAEAVAIQPDGNILLAGINSVAASPASGTIPAFAVARVLAQPSTGPGAIPAEPTQPASFDGTGRSNLAVYLPTLGEVYYRPSFASSSDKLIFYGVRGAGQTLPAPADYLGTGQTQMASYLPSLGRYDILYSVSPVLEESFNFGIPGPGQTIPAPGDYEGTGKSDIAVYLTSLGAFGIRPSSGGADKIIPFGIPGVGQTIPTPGDYFGTGQDDIAAYLPSLGAFALRNPNGGPDQIIPFGIAGAGQTIPAPGDYDGSGKTELGVYLPNLGLFAYRPANGGPDVIMPFGPPGDGSIPAPGDYEGVGHTEMAIYDPKYNLFVYRPAGGGADVIQYFGIPGAGQTLPLATQAGALAVSVPGSSPSVKAMSVETGGAGTSGVVRSATIASGSIVPVGPALAMRRVALAPVAQASIDLQKFDI